MWKIWNRTEISYCFSTSSTMRSTLSLDGTWVPWIRLLEVGWKSSPLRAKETRFSCLQHFTTISLNHRKYRKSSFVVNISNERCSFELSIHQRIQTKWSRFPQIFSKLIIIRRNVSENEWMWIKTANRIQISSSYVNFEGTLTVVLKPLKHEVWVKQRWLDKTFFFMVSKILNF